MPGRGEAAVELAQAAGQIGVQHPLGVAPVADGPPLPETGVHRGQHLWAQPGIFGEVDAPPGGYHQLVEAVE